MRFRLTVISIASLTLSCTGTVRELCSTRLPESEKTFSQAIAQLSPPQDRAPASISEPFDREKWIDWAEARLKETQSYIDSAEAEPRFRFIRADLSAMANELVAFHGYATQSNVQRMAASLEKVQQRVQKVRGEVCTPEKLSSLEER